MVIIKFQYENSIKIYDSKDIKYLSVSFYYNNSRYNRVNFIDYEVYIDDKSYTVAKKYDSIDEYELLLDDLILTMLYYIFPAYKISSKPEIVRLFEYLKEKYPKHPYWKLNRKLKKKNKKILVEDKDDKIDKIDKINEEKNKKIDQIYDDVTFLRAKAGWDEHTK